MSTNCPHCKVKNIQSIRILMTDIMMGLSNLEQTEMNDVVELLMDNVIRIIVRMNEAEINDIHEKLLDLHNVFFPEKNGK